MEGIFVILLFIFVISRMASAAKKANAKNAAKGKPPAQQTKTAGFPQQTKNTGLSAYNEAQAQKELAAAKLKAQEKMVRQAEAKRNAGASSSAAQPDVGVMRPDIAPTVATSVRVSPHNHEDMFAGSMNSDHTGEGKDPCHDNAYPAAVSMADDYDAYDYGENEADSSVIPEWTGKEIVRAVIMQEVLNRPAGKYGRK